MTTTETGRLLPLVCPYCGGAISASATERGEIDIECDGCGAWWSGGGTPQQAPRRTVDHG
jgi:Zn-finger nucleic acid-binding protein